jgi:uncharacterized membrane protein
MSKRALLALLALTGFFVSLYLALYKLGYIGALTCSVGSCEQVNTSKWATFLGLPVAVWGVGFYAVTFGAALVGLQERFEDSRALAMGLAALCVWGVIFSIYLTYLELFVIHAVCQWCVVSAVIVTLMCVVSLLDLRTAEVSDGEAASVSDTDHSRLSS